MSDTPKRNALITGAARGIGLAIARELAENGVGVVIVDRNSETLAAAIETLRQEGIDALPIEVDVADHAAVQMAAKKIAELGWNIDILVNNAGFAQPKSILEISEQEWDDIIGVHLKGAFNWCKALAPGMVERGFGRIVNMSSVNALTGGGPLALSKVSYATAKAGLLGMTRALARELAPNVCVNAVCPGSIDTELTAGKFVGLHQEIIDSIPLGRFGAPQDIAKVVGFLTMVEPCFVTGEVIDIDGGQYIN